MIEKLYKLGSLLPAERLEYDKYRLELDNLSNWETLVIQLDIKNDGSVSFKGISIVEYKKDENLKHWFFKRPPPRNNVSDFPSISVNGSDVSFKENEKSSDIKYWNKLTRILRNCEKKEPSLKPLRVFFETNEKEIRRRISEFSQNKKDNYLLTIEINNQSIGQSPYFTNIRKDAEKEAFKEYYTLRTKEIKPQEKICSVCMKKKPEVWGYPSIYNFYAAKTEFAPISGGFKQYEAWKNYSICPECASLLDKAKYFIEKKANYHFCGFNYFLIPEILDSCDKGEGFHQILDIFFDPETALGRFGLNREFITQDENEILDLVKEGNNRVNYTLFFYKQDQAKFSILLNIEDVYPSQFRELFAAKKRAEEHSVFKSIRGIYDKDQIDDLRFRFDLIKSFMPFNNQMSNVLGDFSKSFLEIVRQVFLKKSVDSKYLIMRMIFAIRHYFINEYNYNHLVLKTFLVLNFFYEMGIIVLNSCVNGKEVNVSHDYQSFFEEFSSFFDSNAKKAIFLEGVLCQKLLNIQYKERKAKPFRKRLNGLKLNPKIIKRLLPEIIEKLEQYDKNYYHYLEKEISSFMIASDLSDLSNDEISYCFVLGMSLSSEFKKEEKEVENGHQE